MKFTDPIDQGSHLAQVHIDSALAEHAKKMAPEQKKVWKDDGNGGQVLEWEHLNCIDCDDPIEEKRLENARVRCTRCQTIKEHKEKQYARR